MSFIEALQAAVLGVVEGLTEFLPISSTGHLIIAADWIGFSKHPFANTFLVAIQAGAILAVCWYYRGLIFGILRNLFKRGPEQRLALNTIIAFLPAVLVGLVVADFIKAHCFNIVTVVTTLIAGGVVLLWIEKRTSSCGARPARIERMQDMTWREALGVGIAQCFAMIPGTSRSGSTIVGGLLLGLSRKAATEFSFFLGIPTILGATVFDLWHSRTTLMAGQWSFGLFAIGFCVSFVSALAVVKWLIGFVSRNDYRPFGWYRIGFGILLLLLYFSGLVTF